LECSINSAAHFLTLVALVTFIKLIKLIKLIKQTPFIFNGSDPFDGIRHPWGAYNAIGLPKPSWIDFPNSGLFSSEVACYIFIHAGPF